MDGDALVWLVLLSCLLILNTVALFLNKKNKMPLWLAGIVISLLGPLIASMTGSFFIDLDHKSGGTGEGAAYGAAFIGIIIIANGMAYLITGMIVKGTGLVSTKNNSE
ncbi:ABC transporter permease [Peribacillus sp. SCS-26]|uniref:ABC transporter permease n=1 Tax=Paraperibacillus marinus TaxID=3115295 RepID=UPI0039060D09